MTVYHDWRLRRQAKERNKKKQDTIWQSGDPVGLGVALGSNSHLA